VITLVTMKFSLSLLNWNGGSIGCIVVGTDRVNRFLTSQGNRFLGFQGLFDSYKYSPERLNNTSITLRHIFPCLSTWYQSGKILDLAAAPLPHRATPGEVDLHDPGAAPPVLGFVRRSVDRLSYVFFSPVA
jgi:hypothetical protein